MTIYIYIIFPMLLCFGGYDHNTWPARRRLGCDLSFQGFFLSGNLPWLLKMDEHGTFTIDLPIKGSSIFHIAV